MLLISGIVSSFGKLASNFKNEFVEQFVDTDKFEAYYLKNFKNVTDVRLCRADSSKIEVETKSPSEDQVNINNHLITVSHLFSYARIYFRTKVREIQNM